MYELSGVTTLVLLSYWKHT